MTEDRENSRRELLFTKLRGSLDSLNARCNRFSDEVAEIEKRLHDMRIGVCVRIQTTDGDYGYRRVGEKWRLVAFLEGTDQFKPMSELNREQKLAAHEWLDSILESIVEEAIKLIERTSRCSEDC